MRTVALAAGLALVAAACGGDDGGADDPAAGHVARLALLPASVIANPEFTEIATGDIDAAAAALADATGDERPDRHDVDAATRHLGVLAGLPVTGPDGSPQPSPVFVRYPALFGPEWFAALDEVDAELGWNALDVSWFVEYSVPPDVVTVVGGDLAVEQLDEAMGAADDGVWRIGAGDDGFDLADRSPARPLGRQLNMALDDGRLTVARSRDLVDDVRALADDADGATLADHPVLRPLAEAMDAEDVYAASLIIGSFAHVPLLGDGQAEPDPMPAEPDPTSVLPAPFVGLAIGWAYGDGGPTVVLAYAHAGADAAEANEAAVGTMVADGASLLTGVPWTERFEAVDVRVDGTTVVARLTLAADVPAAHGYQVVTLRDGLATHR